MAQPRVELDWKILDTLLQFKVTLKYCAHELGVSERTIQRRIEEEKGMTFEEYHTNKLTRTGVKLQQKAIEMAIAGNTTMMIFALKNIALWSDKIESNVTQSLISINIDTDDSRL